MLQRLNVSPTLRHAGVCGRLVVLLVAVGVPSPLLALEAHAPPDILQQVAAYQPPDPDLGSDPKYFFFHKRGITEDAAARDLAECNAYALDVIPSVVLPEYLTQASRSPNGTIFNGPVGDMIIDAAMNYAASGVSRINMRICMRFKGYRLHLLSKELWMQLHDADDATIAKLSSGPTPASQGFEP